MTSDILVTAIMPTRGRQRWASEALAMFLAQDYPLKELVIIDDLSDPSFLHPPEGAIYERAGRLNIGAKRNLACSRANGDVICHWDSDDMYRPDRISSQLERLIASNADLVGYNAMDFVDASTGKRYEYHGTPGYCIGVSMMYWRDSWQKRPFDPIDVGEDNAFMAGRTCVSSESDGQIIARIHDGNTSDKRQHMNTKQWRLKA
jgi:glycosyltransferase involved in cell wall biosynthesis